MKVFRLLTILLLLFTAGSSFADHFVGYDMQLINVKGPGNTPTNNYFWRLRIYRDIKGIAIPGAATFAMYKQNDNSEVAGAGFTCTKVNAPEFLEYPPEDCAPPTAQLSVEVGIYESPIQNYASLNNPAGYYVASSTCCRNEGIINVQGDSWSYGIVFTMSIPRLNTGSATQYNSSPYFKKYPLTIFCAGKPYTLNWEVSDPDGDSLVFSLAQPLDDGNVKPHNLIPYAAGYNLNYNIIDGVPDLTINPKTGIINFITTRAGKYLVAFKVEEYRKIGGVPTKIGEIRREYQLESIICLDAPPVTEDNNNQKRVIIDTVNFPNDITITFTSRDSPNDSLFMTIFPEKDVKENVLNPSGLDGKWGELGNLSGGQAAENLVIEGVSLVEGQFYLKPKCYAVREAPYKFTVVVRDKTCPSPFYDSTFVFIYVRKPDNNKPMFVNKYHEQVDTIKHNTSIIKRNKKYYVNAGDLFQLNGDSIIKTYDKDSSQVVNIVMIPDPFNPRTANSEVIFDPIPTSIHSTARFIWQTDCNDRSDTSYKFNFFAYDNDCKKKDTVRFSIEIFIRDQPNQKPYFAKSNVDTVRIPEGKLDSFTIVLYDTVGDFFNRYKNITLLPDLSDFSNVVVQGGSMIDFTSLNASDSLKVTFKWKPNCANVRTAPYRLFMKTLDEGCPTIPNFDTVYVFATGPFNSAPEFIDQNRISFNIVDTAIYGGELFQFPLHAIDTNTRFDSVFVSLDQSSEIADPTIVQNVAFVIEVADKDSAKTNLVWQTTCTDIRPGAYIARVIARDNECVSPETNTLTFNILVKERPNFIPQFTFANPIETVDTVYAGEIYTLDISAFDTTQSEDISIDTVYTTIPSNLPKPTITRATGLGTDTLSTTLTWIADCSLISDDPYYIKLASWDGACRAPQDSARHTLKIYVLRNPLLEPSLNFTRDTTIELVAGEKFNLELNSRSIIPGDSINISSYGEVYGGIPGTLATFEQTNATAEGNALFTWNTSCDQIRDSAYSVYFTTENRPCKTAETGFSIRFKIIPNTDVVNEIPNVFSPNGDGRNDTYSIKKQYKVYCDPGFKFTIFNRWGKIVFESVDPDFEWNAESFGSGTYFYTLESRARSQNGTIDIIK